MDKIVFILTKKLIATAGLAATLFVPVTSSAASVDIVSYDIENASISGCGGWHHIYAGTIAPDGGSGPLGCDLADYSGGSGTLNDGVIGNDIDDIEIFDGPATITLHLADTVSLSDVAIFGGDDPDNTIPGLLTGATFAFGGSSATIGSSDFGLVLNGDGLPVNDRFAIGGTALDGLAGDTLIISNITGPLYFDSAYSIAEIQVDAVAITPEPTTFLLFGGGLSVILWAGRRRARILS